MLSIISCAKKNSIRLPGKNTKELNGIPLLQYTINTMLFLKEHLKTKLLIITDCVKCKKIAYENEINVLWDKMTDKGMDFNRWIHEQVVADKYILLQPTNPLRDNHLILKWGTICINNNIQSAFSVFKRDRKNYVMNGNFFYYHYTQLGKNDLIDENSLMFIDKYFLDIDTKEDFEIAKGIYEN